MAYNKYRNKYSRGLSTKLKMRNLRWFILAVVVLVVLLFVLLKGDNKKPVAAGDDDSIVALPKDVVIENENASDTKPVKVEESPTRPKTIPAVNEEVTETVNAVTDAAKQVAETSAQTQPTAEEQAQAQTQTTTENNLNIPMDRAQKLMQYASAQKQSGKIISARETLNEVLSLSITPLQRQRIKTELSELANMWLFSKSVFPGDKLTSAYQVQSGDSLAAIGSRYKVPAEFLMRINGIDDARRLQAGQSIKVVNGPFNAVVTKSTFTLDVYLQNTYIKSFKVGTGLPGKDTPTGKWMVKRDGKLITPPWPNPEGGIVYPDDPEYPLGSRWIGIDGIEGAAKMRTGFGIHGTKDPETIGTQSSQGCIRLYNGEVIELYDMLMPELSLIWIRE